MWWLAVLALSSGTLDSLEARVVSVAPGEALQVTAAGAGAPVVLIPGLFGGAYGFRKLVPLLVAGGHRVVVIEPLGVGTSARPERADYSLDAQADRVAAVLDTLGLRETVLVAHSVGAGIALRIAYRRPELVRRLVSLDGGPAERAATPGLRHAAEWAPWVKLMGGVKLVRSKIHAALIKASGDTTWVSDEVVEGYTEGAARDLDGTLKAFLRMAESREHEKLAPHLPEIRCPVRLVLGGAPHPEALSSRDLELLRTTLPQLVVDTIAGAGHHLHEEQPAAVAALVEAAP
ncbi:MAG TPA: alpha/beta hydrolase [Gemmatimonadales bacterium]